MTIRIGAGAGFQGDRIEPAVDLAERGALDYLVFECLGERTIALAQQARMADPSGGYDPLLERRMRAVLPACVGNGTKIVTNMGAANPVAAARKTRAVARELGLAGLKVAAVTGDDVLDRIGGHVLDETGATCIEQLLYEIHDPARYLQPDVVADFSGVMFEEIGPDRVAVSGAGGAPATGQLKVSVGYRDGWSGEGQISYAGANCVARGGLAAKLVRDRLATLAGSILEERAELIGVNSVWSGGAGGAQTSEVRMRYAARCRDLETARRIGEEVEGLYLTGPAGGGGVTKQVREVLAIASTLMPAVQVPTTFEMEEVRLAVA